MLCQNKNIPMAWPYTYHILSSIVHTFLHWKWCWNIPCALYMRKCTGFTGYTEKGFTIAFMMNKLAMIISFEIILKKINIFFCQKSLWNLGTHYTCTCMILDKILYSVHRQLWVKVIKQWGSVTHQMAVPIPSKSCCVL